MILEDEQNILHLYKDFLRTKGLSVIMTSTTANEAMDDNEKYRPEFVIFDYKLPGKKWVTGCKRNSDEIPVVQNLNDNSV
jgi:DNA-binding response OmpR family regulator